MVFKPAEQARIKLVIGYRLLGIAPFLAFLLAKAGGYWY
jgi:hypothetical protein